MYQIFCDGFTLYDPRIEDKFLLAAKCNLEANTVCEGSISILHSHPHYGQLKPLKSIFEFKQDSHTLFRGRMTDNSRDFHKRLDVDLEGVLAFANDSIIPPFILENKTLSWGNSTETCPDDDVVKFFLGWIIDRHNDYVEPWQQLKLGTVHVTDPTIARSSTDYTATWEILKKHLFDSKLGGYLYVRYEDDGNYVDYVDEFEYTNTQHLTLGKNIIDILTTSDANATYSAIMPLGGEALVEDGTDYEGDYVTIQNGVKKKITLEDLEDGDLTEDLVKKGNYIYSKAAVDKYGWICVPLADSENKDITEVEALKNWAMEYLTGTAMLLTNTITIKAVDLSLTDEQIQTIRPYRNTVVDAPVHDINNAVYPLPKIELDILTPQGTVITLGDTKKSLIDFNIAMNSDKQSQIEEVKYEVQKVNVDIMETVKEQTTSQMTQVITQCNEIILAALESYVETSNFEEYKETVATQLQILADEIVMQFTTVTEHITDVDGDLQNKFTEVYKYISFADGSITLGSSENAITLTVENDMIVFKKNGLQFGWWDGVDFHTGNIVVEVNERAQFGNFAFIPRSDGSLMFLKVGG